MLTGGPDTPAPAANLRQLASGFGREISALAAGTASTWVRLLPNLVSLTLLGWAAYHGSVLLGAQVALMSPWLVIAALALGVVIRLATLVIALRMVARYLGAPELMRQVIPEQVVQDERDRGLARLLTITLLPFLGVYAAFGYVNSFAQDVVFMSAFSVGTAGLLEQLNPISSVVTTAVVIAAAALLYFGRRSMDVWFERTGNVAAGFLAVFLEATLLLLVALSGFRIIETAQLWLHDRALMQWGETITDWLSGLLHLNLPDFIGAAWEFVRRIFWPVFWEVLTQPIAWLTLTALVFGSRVVGFADLWRVEARTAEPRATLAQRGRGRLAASTGARRVVLRVQATFLGDLDDKYLPSWQSLKLVLRAGWTFLAAYIVGFNVLRLAGEWLNTLTLQLIGGTPFAQAMALAPLVNLISDVLIMSLQFAFLGATFTRILTLAAAQPPVGRRLGRNLSTGWLTEMLAVVALLVVFTGASMLKPSDSAADRVAAIGQDAHLDTGVIRVEGVDYGCAVDVDQGGSVHTPAAFVLVRLAYLRPESSGEGVAVTLANGARRYRPGNWAAATPLPQPGFQDTVDLLFEVDPADLNGSLEAEITPSAAITAYHDVVHVPLGLPADADSNLTKRTISATNDIAEVAK